jgi:hypothetical protein
MIAEKIDLEEIASSNLAAIGYNDRKRIAGLRFKSGDVFHYADVPAEVFASWYLAESRGKFYAANIRGQYRGEKMTGTCPKCGDRPGWIGETCESCGCAPYAADERKQKGAEDGTASSV